VKWQWVRSGCRLCSRSLSVATKTKAIKPSELSRVIVDTTVQPRNVTFPTDAKLLNRAREKLMRLAQIHAVPLRQSHARVGKFALIQHQRYALAKQFKRANRMLKKLRNYLAASSATSAARSRTMAASKRRSQRCYCRRGACANRRVISAAEGAFPACAGSRMHRQRQSP
jgi:hypothetical protein